MKTNSPIPFIKMQGLGNDFVIFNELWEKLGGVDFSGEMVRDICDRRRGIGADQVLFIRHAEHSEADARMEIRNADGSVGEMCGNGIRAVALLLYRHFGGRRQFTIETLAGLKQVEVDDAGLSVRVDMGVPRFEKSAVSDGGESLSLKDGSTVRFFPVDMGNPHAVVFVDQLESYQVEKIGPMIETHPRFKQGTNVEFVEIKGPQNLRLRVWERGAGQTLACGTGACAAVVAALLTGRATTSEQQVHLDGGVLRVSWRGEGATVFMEGPAKECFRGSWRLP